MSDIKPGENLSDRLTADVINKALAANARTEQIENRAGSREKPATTDGTVLAYYAPSVYDEPLLYSTHQYADVLRHENYPEELRRGDLVTLQNPRFYPEPGERPRVDVWVVNALGTRDGYEGFRVPPHETDPDGEGSNRWDNSNKFGLHAVATETIAAGSVGRFQIYGLAAIRIPLEVRSQDMSDLATGWDYPENIESVWYGEVYHAPLRVQGGNEWWLVMEKSYPAFQFQLQALETQAFGLIVRPQSAFNSWRDTFFTGRATLNWDSTESTYTTILYGEDCEISQHGVGVLWGPSTRGERLLWLQQPTPEQFETVSFSVDLPGSVPPRWGTAAIVWAVVDLNGPMISPMSNPIYPSATPPGKSFYKSVAEGVADPPGGFYTQEQIDEFLESANRSRFDASRINYEPRDPAELWSKNDPANAATSGFTETWHGYSGHDSFYSSNYIADPFAGGTGTAGTWVGFRPSTDLGGSKSLVDKLENPDVRWQIGYEAQIDLEQLGGIMFVSKTVRILPKHHPLELIKLNDDGHTVDNDPDNIFREWGRQKRVTYNSSRYDYGAVVPEVPVTDHLLAGHNEVGVWDIYGGDDSASVSSISTPAGITLTEAPDQFVSGGHSDLLLTTTEPLTEPAECTISVEVDGGGSADITLILFPFPVNRKISLSLLRWASSDEDFYPGVVETNVKNVIATTESGYLTLNASGCIAREHETDSEVAGRVGGHNYYTWMLQDLSNFFFRGWSGYPAGTDQLASAAAIADGGIFLHDSDLSNFRGTWRAVHRETISGLGTVSHPAELPEDDPWVEEDYYKRRYLGIPNIGAVGLGTAPIDFR